MSPRLALNSQLAETVIKLLIFLLCFSSIRVTDMTWAIMRNEKVTFDC